MLLRKHISSGRIISITQPDFERIIEIKIEHLDELGDVCQKRLIVEIMGKHSNIIFCDDKSRIIDSIKHVSAQMSSVREVLPGREYFIPETTKKEDPLLADRELFIQTLSSSSFPLSKALYTGFTGISPVVAEEICYLSGLESRMTARDMTEEMFLHLYKQFSYLYGADFFS